MRQRAAATARTAHPAGRTPLRHAGASAIASLQQAYGNQAVLRALAGTDVLRRKCACQSSQEPCGCNEKQQSQELRRSVNDEAVEEIDASAERRAEVESDSESEEECAAALEDEAPVEADGGDALARSNGKPRKPKRKLRYWRIFGGLPKNCLIDTYRHAKPPKQRTAEANVLCVTTYHVNRKRVVAGQQPTVWNQQTDLDLPRIGERFLYDVRWDMDSVPDRMIVTQDRVEVMNQVLTGVGQRLFHGPGKFHIRVVPNAGPGSTRYRFDVFKVARYVKKVTTCRWHGIIPMGRRKVEYLHYDPKKSYADPPKRKVTYRRARQLLR